MSPNPKLIDKWLASIPREARRAISGVISTADAGDNPLYLVGGPLRDLLLNISPSLDIDLVVLGGPAFGKDISEIFLTEIGRAVNAHPVARETRPVVVEESMLQTDAAAVGAASTIFHDAFTPRVSGSSQARRLPK